MLHCCTCSQALEKDLADLKARAASADALQQQLERANQQLAAHGGEVEALQQELGQCRERIATLEFDLHGALRWLLLTHVYCGRVAVLLAQQCRADGAVVRCFAFYMMSGTVRFLLLLLLRLCMCAGSDALSHRCPMCQMMAGAMHSRAASFARYI